MPDNWIPYAKKTHSIERKYHASIRGAIKRFRTHFLNDLRSHGANTATNNLTTRVLDQSIAKALTGMYRDAGLAGARMQNQLTPRMVEVKAGGFGKNERWIKEVLQYLKEHLFDFIQGITQTMRGDILKVMQKAVDEGWGIDQIVKELRDEGLVASRARVIARTEINRAANVGHATAAKDLPYEVDKQWVAALDERTRLSHQQINKHTVGEDDTFRVKIYKGDTFTGAYDEMQFPGDPTASAGNTINCRCRVIYLPKRDAAGRLMMKDRNQAPVIPMKRIREIDIPTIAAQLKSLITISVKD